MSEIDNRWETVQNIPEEYKFKKAQFELGHWHIQAEQFLANTNNSNKPFLGEDCFELFLERRGFKKLDGQYAIKDFVDCAGVYQEFGYNPKERALPYGAKIISHLDNWRPDYWLTFVETDQQMKAIIDHDMNAPYCSWNEKVTGRYVEVKGSSWLKNTDFEAMKRFNEMLIEQNRIDAKAGKGSIRQIRAEFVIQFHFLAEKSWYQIDDPTRRKDWKPNMAWSKEKQEFYPSLRTVETYATVTFDELEKLYNEAGELHQQAIGNKNPLEVDTRFQEVLRRDHKNPNSNPQKKQWIANQMHELGYEDYEDVKYHRRLDLSAYEVKMEN